MSRQSAIQKTQSNQIQVNTPQSATIAASGSEWSYLPAIDVLEREQEYTLEFDAPGLAIDQIDLTYKHGVLHLHGPVQQRHPQEARFIRQEYGVGDFDRTIQLGRLAEFIDGESINARYEAGVLTVHLPKLAKAQSRKVPVQSA